MKTLERRITALENDVGEGDELIEILGITMTAGDFNNALRQLGSRSALPVAVDATREVFRAGQTKPTQ